MRPAGCFVELLCPVICRASFCLLRGRFSGDTILSASCQRGLGGGLTSPLVALLGACMHVQTSGGTSLSGRAAPESVAYVACVVVPRAGGCWAQRAKRPCRTFIALPLSSPSSSSPSKLTCWSFVPQKRHFYTHRGPRRAAVILACPYRDGGGVRVTFRRTGQRVLPPYSIVMAVRITVLRSRRGSQSACIQLVGLRERGRERVCA